MSFFHPPNQSATLKQPSLKLPAPLCNYPTSTEGSLASGPQDTTATSTQLAVSAGPFTKSHRAFDLLHQIQNLIPQLPETVPEVTALDTLSAFLVDPCSLTGDEDEIWETVNKMLHSMHMLKCDSPGCTLVASTSLSLS